jgi:hypothetical protein
MGQNAAPVTPMRLGLTFGDIVVRSARRWTASCAPRWKPCPRRAGGRNERDVLGLSSSKHRRVFGPGLQHLGDYPRAHYKRQRDYDQEGRSHRRLTTQLPSDEPRRHDADSRKREAQEGDRNRDYMHIDQGAIKWSLQGHAITWPENFHSR